MSAKAALFYRKMGYSVIPVKADKRPFIKWEPYQKKPAAEAQIRQWWKKWPNANVAIVTGKESNLTVVDADSEAGRQNLEENFLTDGLVTPIAKTPHGYHYWFTHEPGILNSVRCITDCDVRNDGGYVVAPPSRNGEGAGYKWLSGLKVSDVKPAKMPVMLAGVLRQGGDPRATTASSSEHIKKVASLYKKKIPIGGDTKAVDPNRPHVTPRCLKRATEMTPFFM